MAKRQDQQMPNGSKSRTAGTRATATQAVTLNGEYIELCQLLKLAGIAASGGEGKHIVAAGEVTVDGRPESRKTAKIRAGQQVVCRGVSIRVTGPAHG
jgi:ribosome-associated protein